MQLKWPQYEVADDETLRALGVVSVNFARWERTHVWMLAAVANLTEANAANFVRRMNNPDRADAISARFKARKWPADAEEAIQRYLDAFKVLVTNRNTLIHANLVRGMNEQVGIFTTNRKGETSMFHSSLEDVRRVADDLQTYFDFGLALANFIATEIHAVAREAGMLVVSVCPDLPPPPNSIRPPK
jgi:hypothetical protein